MNEDRQTLVDIIKNALRTFDPAESPDDDALARFIAMQVSGAGFRRRSI